MELNGVANIKLILEDAEDRGLVHPQTAADIYLQLNILERYMVAISVAKDRSEKFWSMATGVTVFTEIPAWHDVRDNLEKYPNARELFEGLINQSNHE